MSAREFKMPFGKYKGETLEEIYIHDIGYLEWLLDECRKEEAEPSSFGRLIQECFKEMRNVRICE